MSDQPPRAGLFGKMPSRGDFIRRDVPPGFARPWDEWLQGALDRSRADLGDRWLTCFLNAPIWRFLLSAGICGDRALAGVLMPSVDSVGRYFPLTLVAAVPDDIVIPRTASVATAWFDAAEVLALAHLDPKADIDDLAARLERLGAPADESLAAGATHLVRSRPLPEILRFQLSEMTPEALATEVCPASLDRVVRLAYRQYSMWWTVGGEHVPPTVILYAGLPPVEAFARFLDDAEAMAGDS